MAVSAASGANSTGVLCFPLVRGIHAGERDILWRDGEEALAEGQGAGCAGEVLGRHAADVEG